MQRIELVDKEEIAVDSLNFALFDPVEELRESRSANKMTALKNAPKEEGAKKKRRDGS